MTRIQDLVSLDDGLVRMRSGLLLLLLLSNSMRLTTRSSLKTRSTSSNGQARTRLAKSTSLSPPTDSDKLLSARSARLASLRSLKLSDAIQPEAEELGWIIYNTCMHISIYRRACCSDAD